jgi:O-antigen/teichoic acid export membrane protein
MRTRTTPLSSQVRPSSLVAYLADQAIRIQKNSLLRNSVYIMAITVVTSGLGYLYWIVAAHLYPPKAVGLASAIISAMSITVAVSSAGIGQALVQMLPQRRSDHEWSLTLNAGLIVGILASAPVAVIAVAIMQFILRIDFGDQQPIYIALFIMSVPLWALATLLDRAFVAERLAGKALARNTTFAAVKIPLLAVPFFWTWAGALAIFDTWIISTIASLALGVALLSKLGRAYRPAIRGFTRYARSMFSAITGHHLIELGGVAPMYLLPLLVTARLSAADNAYFYPASMTGIIFFMFSSSVALSLFAEGSYTSHDIARKLRSSMLIIAVLLFPTMLIVFIGRHYILSLFGPGYAQHGEVLLTILIVSAIPDAITNLYVAWLRVRKLLRYAALLSIGMALLTLLLAWILLPHMGIAGAAWAGLIAQLLGSLVVGIHLLTRRISRSWADRVGATERASEYSS